MTNIEGYVSKNRSGGLISDDRRVIMQLKMALEFGRPCPADFSSEEEVISFLATTGMHELDRPECAKPFWRKYKAWKKRNG